MRVAVVALLLVVLLSGSMVATAEAGGRSDSCAKRNSPPECQVPGVDDPVRASMDEDLTAVAVNMVDIMIQTGGPADLLVDTDE